MKRTKKIQSLTNRGHGIGAHSWNDTIISLEAGKPALAVNQIIVRDVFGENCTRYDVVTGEIRGANMAVKLTEEQAPWTWAQVREVVARDLATIGREIGQAYGRFEDTTAFGLYHGRRPRWMDKAEWDRRNAEGR